MSDFKPGDINKLELDYTQNSVYKFDLPCSPVNLTGFPVFYKNGVETPGSVCGRNNCPRRKKYVSGGDYSGSQGKDKDQNKGL